jgi:squalene-associated FAD-dependent desaturase
LPTAISLPTNSFLGFLLIKSMSSQHLGDSAVKLGPQIAIVGGGLAGLAAAVALADRGLRIHLFEARRMLGGRASSFRDPNTGELIDHCQHVSLGCCTNLADCCRRTGLADLLATHDRLHFFGPDGRRHDVAPSRWLPAPLHLLPSLLRLKYLSLRERWRLIRGIRRLSCSSSNDDPSGPTIGQWLRTQGQSERAIDLFWTPIIVSALSETVDRAAVAPVRKLFVDAFLSSRRACQMQIPNVPLSEFYGSRLEQWLADRGVELNLGTPIKQLVGDRDGVRQLYLPDGPPLPIDAVILAVPWRRAVKLLGEKLPELGNLERLDSAPITAVHLWFTEPITDLPHAVLPGRLSQWMFNHSIPPLPRGEGRGEAALERPASGYHYQIVISASRDLAQKNRDEITATVLNELAAIWPLASNENLLRSRVITSEHAVFSPQPGADRFRPPQQTSIPNLFLAGDWTATGWPATMEGAVRSGYLAAEKLLAHLGRPGQILAPDLSRAPLARFMRLGSSTHNPGPLVSELLDHAFQEIRQSLRADQRRFTQPPEVLRS